MEQRIELEICKTAQSVILLYPGLLLHPGDEPGGGVPICDSEGTGISAGRTDTRDDSIPRLAWGKYRKTGEQVELGLSIDVNHRLIDGLHIGQFAQALTAQIDCLGE